MITKKIIIERFRGRYVTEVGKCLTLLPSSWKAVTHVTRFSHLNQPIARIVVMFNFCYIAIWLAKPHYASSRIKIKMLLDNLPNIFPKLSYRIGSRNVKKLLHTLTTFLPNLPSCTGNISNYKVVSRLDKRPPQTNSLHQ